MLEIEISIFFTKIKNLLNHSLKDLELLLVYYNQSHDINYVYKISNFTNKIS